VLPLLQFGTFYANSYPDRVTDSRVMRFPFQHISTSETGPDRMVIRQMRNHFLPFGHT
jgi:hypothetical protein